MKVENKENTIKKSVDIPVSLFEQIMKYAHDNKIYKFGPALIKILEDSLNEKK